MVLKSTCFLIALSVIIDVCEGQTLTESEPVIIRPGNNHKLICTFSGIALDKAYISWIRQAKGKGLEWISYISAPSGTDKYYSKTVEGRFTISRDNSKLQVYLHMTNLQDEDTAVYYCARERAAFDYWGKGTQVTVTSAPNKAPAVFMMSDCGSSDPRLLGCLASEFSPEESVSFKWTDQSGKALTDFVQYRTVTTNGKMVKLSHITVTTETLKGIITCEAVHPLKTEKKTFRKVSAQAPTVSVIPVTTQKSTSVMCVIEDFYPKNVTVQWKLNNVILQEKTEMEYKKNEDTGLYTALSLYKVNSETWNKHIDYTCEVTHMGQVQSDKKNFKASLGLTLKTPIQRELFVNNEVILQAVISGNERNSVESALVSCKMENEAIKLQKGVVQSSKDISGFQKIDNVTVDTEKWFEGKKVICSISDKSITQEIYFNKGDARTPKVSLYEQEIDSTDPTHISMVCEVTSPKLGDVYIMWEIDDKKYEEGYTSAPILRGDSTSVLSIYKVSKEVYRKETRLSCSVKHANMDKDKTPIIKSTSQSKSKCPACPVSAADY